MKNSVCIPTFNGERYIKAQIDSILRQLGQEDEIIISDDSSCDRTIEIIRSIQDRRIKVYDKNNFRSPIYNVESSISRAQGDIIYLADQDDIWLPNKVSRINALFSSNANITLVATDAGIIDQNGTIISNSFYSRTACFNSGVFRNIVKNRFVGCTLAFRRTMLDYLLPFPPDIPMHDVWIGIINEIYGRVYYLDAPLILYRRHENNFSPSVRSDFKKVLIWRWNLVKQIIRRLARITFVHR